VDNTNSPSDDRESDSHLIKFICGLIGVTAVAAYLILGMYVLARLLGT
jgi:hypothetical protein